MLPWAQLCWERAIKWQRMQIPTLILSPADLPFGSTPVCISACRSNICATVAGSGPPDWMYACRGAQRLDTPPPTPRARQLSLYQQTDSRLQLDKAAFHRNHPQSSLVCWKRGKLAAGRANDVPLWHQRNSCSHDSAIWLDNDAGSRKPPKQPFLLFQHRHQH